MYETTFLIGLFGAVLLVVAWIPPSIRTIRKHKTNMPMGYALLYTLGAGLLVIYSAVINEMLFVGLNFIAMLFGIFNIYYVPNKEKRLQELEHEIEELFGRRDKSYYVVKKKKRKKRRKKR